MWRFLLCCCCCYACCCCMACSSLYCCFTITWNWLSLSCCSALHSSSRFPCHGGSFVPLRIFLLKTLQHQCHSSSSSCPSCHLHYLPGFSATLSASSFPLLVFSLAVTLSYSFCSPMRLFLCSQLRLRLSVISFKRTPSPSRSGDIPDARILPFLSLCT